MTAIGVWFAMGGYAVYVWPAYGLAAAVLGGVTLQTWRRYRASVRSLERLQHRPRVRR